MKIFDPPPDVAHVMKVVFGVGLIWVGLLDQTIEIHGDRKDGRYTIA